MLAYIKAIKTGLIDGFDQPGEFGYGMTYDKGSLQLAYDLASHVGQFAGRVVKR